MSKIKNFKDLVFIPHPIAREAQKLPLYLAKEYAEAKQAKMDFENGYGISVLFGSMFYSNGIDTYEVGILKDGILCYATPITDVSYTHLDVYKRQSHSHAMPTLILLLN